MHDYRIEMVGQVIKFVIWIKAATEFDAMQQARRDNPGFTVGDTVKVKENV